MSDPKITVPPAGSPIGWPAHVFDNDEPSMEEVIDHYERYLLDQMAAPAVIDYHSQAAPVSAAHTHLTACGWW